VRVATDLDQLAATLRDGIPPAIRTPADRLAVRLAAGHAERLVTGDSHLLAEGSQLLPTSSQDYVFDGLWRDLLDITTPRRLGSRTT
jgi:hypothetical protein